jgi:hypothetical protein
MKIDSLTVHVWRAAYEACSGNLEVSATIPAFVVVHRENQEKTSVEMAGLQDLPGTD